MTKLSILCVFIVLCSSVLTNENESEKDENENCKAIYSFGYGYRQFFHLSESILNSKSRKGDLLIKFKVRAKSDAHILLSPTPSPEETDPVYEIVLGAGRNSFSDIRRKRRAATRTSAFTRDILSGTELKGFWIRLGATGLIEVGKEGDDLAFMYWQDTEPLPVKYISFCTWSGIVGKWLHDCEEGEVIKHVSTTVRLKQDLLKNYDRYSRPVIDSETTMPISIGLITNLIQLDAKKSKLTVHGSFSMLWFDEKMQWEPDEYDNVTTLNFVNHELWAPEFVLYNAVGNGASPLRWSKMTLSSLGQVNWKPEAILEARCYLNLTYWPWDTQTCSVQLGFWSEQDALQIIIMENGTRLMDLQKTASEWAITALVAETIKVSNPWFQVSESDGDDVSLDHAVLTFKFTLRRISTVYCYVLFLPLLASIVMMLSCFWMTPFSHEKLSVNCLALLILCAMLITLQKVLPAPPDHTPYLLRSYSHVMLVVAMSTMMSVLVITISRSFHLGPPPKFLCSTLSSWVANTFLCLPEPMSLDVNLYEHPNEGDSRSIIQSSTMSLVTVKDIDTNQYWSLLAVFLDRITFIIASLILAVLLIP